MTAIEEMAGMDVLCSDKTGTLTLNKLTVDKNLIEVGKLVYNLHLTLNLDIICVLTLNISNYRSLLKEWMQILLF